MFQGSGQEQTAAQQLQKQLGVLEAQPPKAQKYAGFLAANVPHSDVFTGIKKNLKNVQSTTDKQSKYLKRKIQRQLIKNYFFQESNQRLLLFFHEAKKKMFLRKLIRIKQSISFLFLKKVASKYRPTLTKLKKKFHLSL